MELVLAMIDSSDLEVAVGLVRKTFMITDKRGRVPGASACHSHLPACLQDKHEEPGLLPDLFALVARNSVLEILHFPAAFIWQRGWVWADLWVRAGSKRSLKIKGI